MPAQVLQELPARQLPVQRNGAHHEHEGLVALLHLPGGCRGVASSNHGCSQSTCGLCACARPACIVFTPPIQAKADKQRAFREYQRSLTLGAGAMQDGVGGSVGGSVASDYDSPADTYRSGQSAGGQSRRSSGEQLPPESVDHSTVEIAAAEAYVALLVKLPTCSMVDTPCLTSPFLAAAMNNLVGRPPCEPHPPQPTFKAAS